MTTTNLDEYRISIKKIKYSEGNSYSGITLLYLLKGKIELMTADSYIELKEQQIHLINKNVHYSLMEKEDNLLITLEIANSYIIRYYPIHLTCSYNLSSTKNLGNEFENSYLNDAMLLIAKIVVIHIQKNTQYLLDINRLLSELLLIITSFSQIESNNTITHHSAYSPKIEKIVQYIKNNYSQKLSLQEIAKKEYISFSHLSRLFKKEVGVGFSQYISQLRFESTINDLINTSKRIYQIAEQHGFSNIKQFIALFKKRYGCTPSQFRKNHQQGIIPKQNKNHIEQSVTAINLSEVIYLLSQIIHSSLNSSVGSDRYNRIENQEIVINSNDKCTKIPEFCYTLFVGEVNELLKFEVQKQLLITKKEIAVDYVEVSHLITGNSILPDFSTDEFISTYNPYANTDTAINFLNKNNISLCIRINHDNICHNIDSYTQKLNAFIKHYIEIFGLNYVKKWRFVYYMERISQLNSPVFDLAFNCLFNLIKQQTQTAALGIFYPFTYYPFSYRSSYRDEPLFHHNVIEKVDFIGYSASFDENSLLLENEAHISQYVSFIYNKTSLLKKGLSQNGLSKPLFLMQWNTLTGNTRKTNGSFFRGALLLQTLLDIAPDIKNISLVLNTDTQQEVRANHIDTSSIALFLVHQAPRPIFFILKFIEKLRGKIISMGKNYLITQENCNYQIIITNVSIFNPYLSIQEHLIHSFKQNRFITFKGITSGVYQIKRYLFDQEHGALYRQYEKFQTKYGTNEEVFEYLAQLTKPEFSIKDEYIDINNWQILTELDINALDFYELNYIES